MLIKAADDKQPQIDALEALLTRPDVDAATRTQIDRELKTIRAGARGEREAAYEIDFHYAKHPNRVVIHDLRLEVDGRVAQIDHLIIDRLLTIWVCESKHFAEGVGVNDHGEWVRYWGGRPTGIPSPIEQNRKHIAVLRDAFDQRLVQLPKRLGVAIKPDFRSLILVSAGARISRPRSKAAAAAAGLDEVIKVDQLKTLLDRDSEATRLRDVARFVGSDAIQRIGRELVALHRPAAFDWAAPFGLPAEPPQSPPTEQPATRVGRVCESCGAPVSYGVARYSEAHPERFGGRVLCMPCQKTVAS
jgi:hypothetical protein